MRKIEIAPRTIIFTVVFLLGLYLFWFIQDLLFSLLIAFILMSALKPAVRRLEKQGVSRRLATALVFISFILLIITLFSLIVPPIAIEGTALFTNLPGIVSSLNPRVTSMFQIETLTQYIPNVTSHALEILTGILSNIVFLVSTLFFAFYFILEENVIKKFVVRFFDGKQTEQLLVITNKVESRLSAWFWGQISLMVVIGLFDFVGLSFLGVKYALALGVFAGLMEVVPTIGPILSVVPALIVALSTSSILGLAVIALYFIVQQLENTVIVPWIMKRAVGLDPIITLVALIIGGRLGGVLGVLLSIPILLVVGTFILELRRNKELYESLMP